MNVHAAAQWLSDLQPALVPAAAMTVCAATAFGAVRLWRTTQQAHAVASAAPARRRKISAGTLAAVAAFLICTSVSLNTSYRFTGDPNGLNMIDEAERLLSCAAYESLMAMSVLGARERMADNKSPGWYGIAVWVFAALSSIPAAVEGDGLTPATAVRIIVGSFGSSLAAHAALGLDLKHRTGSDSEAPMAVILRDLRERLMSRMGLTQRNRSAMQIAQERALSAAVDLRDRFERMTPEDKRSKKGAKLAKKLGRALDAAGVATDPDQKNRYHQRVALREHSTSLKITDAHSPWLDTSTTAAAAMDAQTARINEYADEIEAALLQQATTPAPHPIPAPRIAAAEDDETPADCIDPQLEAFTLGGRAAAAEAPARSVTARIPDPDHGDEDDEDDEDQGGHDEDFDVRSYPSKKAALLAAYERAVAPHDPRTHNAIAVDLCQRFGIDMDRGQAWRAIDEARSEARNKGTDEAAAPPEEPTTTMEHAAA